MNMKQNNLESTGELQSKQIVNRLATYTGNGTEMISLYIPRSYDVSRVYNNITSEMSEAKNIKSKQTKKNVQRALKMIQSFLKQLPELPNNGIIIFSGIDSNGDEILEYITPPTNINTYRYHCDNSFLLEPLKSLTQSDVEAVIIGLSLGDASIGYIRGGNIVTVTEIDSFVPNKHRKGGQSAQRFQRRRDEAINDFFKDVGSHVKELIEDVDTDIVIIGGPNITRDMFVSGDYLPHMVSDSIIEVSGDSSSMNEIANLASKELKESKFKQQEELIEEFLYAIREGKAAYGEVNVKTAISYGAVDTLLISDSEYELYRNDVENMGGDVVVISGDSELTQQFENLSNGIGAILRFEY